MPKREAYDNGVPSWVDLGTTDVDAAKRYYAAIFGWEWTGSEMPRGGGTYWMATLGGDLIAGLVAFPPDAAMGSVWNTYVNVHSVDETLAKATGAGGSIIMPATDVEGAGRFAFFKDPGDAILGLWQPRGHRGAGLVNEPGALIWNEVYVEDTAAAIDFYGKVFGWQADVVQTSEGMDYTMLKLGDTAVAGTAPPQPGVVPHWHVWFGSDNVEGVAAKTTKLGGVVDLAPTKASIGTFAFLRDPTGTSFSVIKGSSEQG